MNTKKILSLLLAVVMIVCCGVVAFAAPTGYDAYVQSSTNQILSEGQTLYTGAAMPVLDGEGAIRADVTVTPISDAELYEAYGATPADFGLTTGWVDSGYMVTVDLKNLGTLVYNRTGATAALYKYNGFRMVNAAMNFSFSESDVFCVGALGSSVDESLEKFSGNGFVTEGKVYKVEYQDTAAKTAYPSSGTATDADNFATLLFFAKPGSVVNLSNGYVMYQNFKNNEAKDADGNAWSNTTVAYWHPASIQLGEGGEDKTVTTETDTTTGATKIKYGADVDAADKKLEGKYIVMRDTVAPAGSINKNSRVVVTYTDTDGLGLSNSVEYGKTIFEYLDLNDSEGTVTTRAIKFGVVYTDARYKAANFTFTIK